MPAPLQQPTSQLSNHSVPQKLVSEESEEDPEPQPRKPGFFSRHFLQTFEQEEEEVEPDLNELDTHNSMIRRLQTQQTNADYSLNLLVA